MEGYTLLNRFTERYEIRGRQRVRSREERIFMIKSFVLRKKRECERGKKKGHP
jgi:hypothetical protein